MNHLLREPRRSATRLGRARARSARTLKRYLAARKLVDFSGPHGWRYSATEPRPVRGAAGRRDRRGVTALQRRVLPLIELARRFAVARASCATPTAAPRTSTG